MNNNTIELKEEKEDLKSSDNKYRDLLEINLDTIELEYNEDEDLYYYDCSCDHEILILREKMITETNLILSCAGCTSKIRFVHYNHLV